jgi:hypothetical protein
MNDMDSNDSTYITWRGPTLSKAGAGKVKRKGKVVPVLN